MDIAINMAVNYPQLIGGDKFDDSRVEHHQCRSTLHLSSSRAGGIYWAFWWGGMLGGALLYTIGGVLLGFSSYAFRSQAKPTKIVDPTEDGRRFSRRNRDDYEEDPYDDEYDEDDRRRRRR